MLFRKVSRVGVRTDSGAQRGACSQCGALARLLPVRLPRETEFMMLKLVRRLKANQERPVQAQRALASVGVGVVEGSFFK